MALADLGDLEGWHVEDVAARVHYEGEGDRFGIEYYDDEKCVVYWRVSESGETASPVAREQVPVPLRTRIREDLAAADLDPDVEARQL